MLEIKTDSQSGKIQIADEVIAIIAGTAAMEVEGVAGTSGNLTGDLAERLGRKHLSKGVKVDVYENQVTINISILVKFGYKVQEVSLNVQERVKVAVETMTGLEAPEINIHVSGLQVDKHEANEA